MMINKWLIDTDVLVDYLRGHPKAAKFLDEIVINSKLYVSSITIAELYAGVREGKERPILEQFLQIFEVINIDNKIAQTGGLYRRDYGKKQGVGLADAIIAASADYCAAQLVTLNKKHYPMLEKIYVPYVKK